MKTSIITHIKSCLVCQAYNISRTKRPGFLHPITSPDGPNQLLYSLSQLLDYHHIFCTPYHSQINEPVERFNCTFVTQLAKLTDQESSNWDEYLYPIVFAYNTGVHSTTNISPFELTFGRKANLPTDHPPTTFTFSHLSHHRQTKHIEPTTTNEN
jgi:hypothetical protein